MKIYTDDPNLPYKTTTLKAPHTKSEIDGLFAKWGVKDVYWKWNPEANNIFVQFKIVETIDGIPMEVSAKVQAPIIWQHETRKAPESVNWDICLRVMFWFIKSHLEAAYLLQSSKIAAFLPYIASNDGRVMKDFIIPRLSEIQSLPELPRKVIDISKEANR